jgi:enediyne biosynthesis protein E4
MNTKGGKQDILLGGNFYQSKPEAGIYDGSYGLFLKGTGRGDFKALSISESNFFVKGAIRNMQTIKTNERNIVLIARNNENLKVVEYGER